MKGFDSYLYFMLLRGWDATWFNYVTQNHFNLSDNKLEVDLEIN